MKKIETHLFGEPAARAARNEAASAGLASSSSAPSTTRDSVAPPGRGRGGRRQAQATANARTRRRDEPLQQSNVRSALSRYES
jgi:hypothetical protein